ncbi:phage tail tape measure protein, partial [bacterium]|nr:phage tail tape measure protein [bacterium]
MAAQNELLLKVGLQLDEVIRDFKKLNNVVGGVDDKIKKGSKDWQTSFAKFGLAVNGIEQGFRILDRTVGAAVRGIASFQTEMVRVNTLVNLTTQNFNKLTKQVIGLSKEIPQTVEELSQGLYQVVSAGVDASKAIDFLTVSSKAAVAGFTKTETSVDAITSVINAFGKEADEAESVADVFFTAIRIGKTELDLLAPTLGQFVPQAAAVGVSFEEVAAAMATLTKSAIPTARAATGIGRALTEMVKPASKGEAAIRGLGFASGQAGLDALGFQGTVQALVDDGANLIEIFGDEAARAMLTLGNNAELAASDLDEMTKSAGAMNTAFNLANITLENQRLIMENELQALYLNFSDVLIPGWTRALVNLNAVLKDNGSINAALAKAGDDEVSQLEARKTALDLLQDQFNATGLSRQKQVIFYRENKEALEALGFGVKDFSELNVTMNALMAEAFELTGKITQAKKDETIVVENITKAKKEETEIEAGEK